MKVEQHFLSAGLDVTEDNITLLNERTIYGNSYKIGDHLNYIFIVNGIVDESINIKMVTLTNDELDRFSSEYTYAPGLKYFVPNFMLNSE